MMNKKLRTKIMSDKFVEIKFNPRDEVQIKANNKYYDVPDDTKIILVPRTYKQTPQSSIIRLNKQFKKK